VSEKAGEAEMKMASFLTQDPHNGIHFECVGANLHFSSGRAAGEDIVGANSDISRRTTSGAIDFRDQTYDLHGRLKPKAVASLATFAGDIKITGPMVKPHLSLDHSIVAARMGAAIASVGVTAAATAIADAADPHNACDQVLKGK